MAAVVLPGMTDLVAAMNQPLAVLRGMIEEAGRDPSPLDMILTCWWRGPVGVLAKAR